MKGNIVFTMTTSPIRTFADGILIDQPWGKLTWLASRELGNSTTMTFGRVTIPAGQTNPRHRHPNCDEILHLLTGRLEHSLGERKIPAQSRRHPLHPRRSSGTMPVRWMEKDAEMVICFSSADRETEFEG
jgi:oxalate decarboxylase/phosphoglucose isomerase-like protein (cupin superfamily)